MLASRLTDRSATFALIGLSPLGLDIALTLTDQGYTVYVLDDDRAALAELDAGGYPVDDPAAYRRAIRGNKIIPAIRPGGVCWTVMQACDVAIIGGENMIRFVRL
jgi:UDP-N-acetyl-D-mannosaminuronate dehydrogenase